MENIIFNGAIASLKTDEFTHPGLRKFSVIYCDDLPNSNKQGVKYEDFAEIKQSAVGTPIKINFMKDGPAGHENSIPIGFIQGMVEAEANGVHQLIAEGFLFASDFPEEVDWIQKRFDEGKAPGVSFELGYQTSVFENGVEWFKGLLAKAATFVKFPAYGNRTALLALASDQNLNTGDFVERVADLVIERMPKNASEGGINRMEEELERIKAELATANTALSEKTAELEAKAAEITTLSTENETLKTSLAEKDTAIAEFTNKETVAKRTAELVAAEITVEIKPERLLSMDDAAFAEYVSDLKAVATAEKAKAPKAGFASARGRGIEVPRFESNGASGSDALVGLRERLATAARQTSVATE